MLPSGLALLAQASQNGAYQAGVWTGRVFAIVFLSLLVHKLFFAKKKS